MRALLLVLPTVLMLTGGAVRTADGTAPRARPGSTTFDSARTADPAPVLVSYRLPLAGPAEVLRGFDPPRTRYGAGHLGVDLRAAGAVLAAGAGRVSFAGSVAGRGVVVIVHSDGIATEYEPVHPSVHIGQVLTAGQRIGLVDGAHRGCTGPCLHWGARRGDTYLDPLSLLRALGPVRLLPWGTSNEQGPSRAAVQARGCACR